MSAQLRKPPRLTEADIQRTCTDLLILDGWRALRTDPVSDRARGKGFGETGMADHLYLRYLNRANPNVPVWGTNRRMYNPEAEVMWIEWKRKGSKAATHQKLWHGVERDRGALTLIAGEDFKASIDGFVAWYRASGLNRGRV